MLEVSIKGGVIDLLGTITDERQRTGLHALVENIPGVKGIRDHLVWIEAVSQVIVLHCSGQDRSGTAKPSDAEIRWQPWAGVSSFMSTVVGRLVARQSNAELAGRHTILVMFRFSAGFLGLSAAVAWETWTQISTASCSEAV